MTSRPVTDKSSSAARFSFQISASLVILLSITDRLTTIFLTKQVNGAYTKLHGALRSISGEKKVNVPDMREILTLIIVKYSPN
jgi:hypothetical protein